VPVKEVRMDPLVPRKPQDIDRWSDAAENEGAADPTLGPQDRWVNEAARGQGEYPASEPGEGLNDVNTELEDDGEIRDEPADPLIRGQAG
jgi:hypothetical protein